MLLVYKTLQYEFAWVMTVQVLLFVLVMLAGKGLRGCGHWFDLDFF